MAINVSIFTDQIVLGMEKNLNDIYKETFNKKDIKLSLVLNNIKQFVESIRILLTKYTEQDVFDILTYHVRLKEYQNIDVPLQPISDFLKVLAGAGSMFDTQESKVFTALVTMSIILHNNQLTNHSLPLTRENFIPDDEGRDSVIYSGIRRTIFL